LRGFSASCKWGALDTRFEVDMHRCLGHLADSERSYENTGP
jgi:hypothetical protein